MNVRQFLDENPILRADCKDISVENFVEANFTRKQKNVKMKPVKMIFDKTGWVPRWDGTLEPPNGVYVWHTEYAPTCDDYLPPPQILVFGRLQIKR
jgi:hypothetical protein